MNTLDRKVTSEETGKGRSSNTNSVHFSIMRRADPADEVLTLGFQVDTHKTAWSLPSVLALTYLLASTF